MTSSRDPFPGLKRHSSAQICMEDTIIYGDVVIGDGCVLHPTTKVIAKNGPIVIGSNNLIEERAKIVNMRPEKMIIGDNNVFEVDSYCEAFRVGSGNIIESKSRVGPSIELTNNCIIGAGCILPDRKDEDFIEKLSPNTVISGCNNQRRVVARLPADSRNSQLDFLRKVLPNYQKLYCESLYRGQQ